MDQLLIAIIAFGAIMGSMLIALGVLMAVLLWRLIRRIDALIARFGDQERRTDTLQAGVSELQQQQARLERILETIQSLLSSRPSAGS